MLFKVRPLAIQVNALSPSTLLTVWGHSGRLHPASGTWGSLAALPFVLTIWQTGGWPLLAVFAVSCYLAGLWAIPRYTAQAGGGHDLSEIVLDEVIGIAITFLPLATFRWDVVLCGFAAFRLFDAVKAGPVGWCDRNVPGAAGVMIDDVVAGVLAALCVYAYQSFM